MDEVDEFLAWLSVQLDADGKSEMKRRIIESWEIWKRANAYAADEIREEWVNAVLPILGMFYADRPGYREEWHNGLSTTFGT